MQPTAFDYFSASLKVDYLHACLNIADTGGSTEFDKIRLTAYPLTDIIVVVFSVVNRSSFSNVTSKWIPEIKQHCPHAPFLIVGNKIDLREHSNAGESVGENIVSKVEGEEQARQLGAVAYMECSALTQEGIRKVFETVVRIVREQPQKPQKHDHKCHIM